MSTTGTLVTARDEPFVDWRAIIGGAIVAYFVVFPDDLGFVDRLLRLTQSVAAGAYALLIALVVVAGAVRIWGRPGRADAPAADTFRSGPT
jgi:hypothetical protein